MIIIYSSGEHLASYFTIFYPEIQTLPRDQGHTATTASDITALEKIIRGRGMGGGGGGEIYTEPTLYLQD